MKGNKNKIGSMERMFVHIWDLKGFVYLNELFTSKYKEKIKKYGVERLSRKLHVTYPTLADIYKRRKFVNVNLLSKICEKLNVDKNFAEKSILGFTENQKMIYETKFPFEFTPLTLRVVSMIIGDGHGSLNRMCIWTQHKMNIKWGARLIDSVIKHKPRIKEKPNNCFITIPRFLVKATSNILERKFSKDTFLEDVLNLPRMWRFQVFAQLVVDEGSPDCDFRIAQNKGVIKDLIQQLAISLGYKTSEYKESVHISTESFPLIMKDIKKAKSIFGELGGFWFKDERFDIALENTNPKYSIAMRVNKEKFESVIEKLRKNKQIVTYKELESRVGIPTSSFLTKMRRALKDGSLIKLCYGFYTFPEYSENENIKWLKLSKEEKILKVLENRILRQNELKELTNLGETQLHRAINNLLGSRKIQRIGRGKYIIAKNALS